MTELQAIEQDLETCHTLVKESEELEKALGSKHGKLIMKVLRDGRDSAAKLTTHATEGLRHQGLIGVQSFAWVEQHFDYQRQLATHASIQIEQLEDEKARILADVE